MKQFVNIETKKIWSGEPIITSEGMVFNPSEEQLVNSGWAIEFVEERTKTSSLEDIRTQIKVDAENYYKSESVSGFYLNGRLMWLPTQDRVSFMMHLKSMVDMGLENYLINILDVELTVKGAIDILNNINSYVTECYLVYLEHLEKIKKMSTSYDLETYDFTDGYPTQLEINL